MQRFMVRLGLFVLLTFCGILIFALTMTFVPVMPAWAVYSASAGLLVVLGMMWWVARGESSLSPFRPVFFAYFTAVLSVLLGLLLGEWGLKLFGLTTQTPSGIAVAKALQASVIVIGILATAKLCGEDLASLYLRKGRLLLGLSLGFIGAAVCVALSLQQPDIKAFGISRFIPLIPWMLLFVVPNAFMEELFFRGLFLGRYEPLMGKWMAILSTALAFTAAHMQASYTQVMGMLGFLVVLFGFAVAWGWLMQKTGSLWGSVLFHAGADAFIILAVFKAFGAA